MSHDLSSMKNGLISLIGGIHRQAPHAQIVVVDYYQVIPEANAALAGAGRLGEDLRTTGLRIGQKWRQVIRQKASFVLQQLNGAIVSAATQFPDVAVVDLTNAFEGHEMCTLNSWLFDDIHNAGHPTGNGQVEIAAAVLSECAKRPNDCVGRP
jgi:hypothetical protein